MNSSTQITEIAAKPVKGRSLWADGIRRLRKRKFAIICLAIVSIYFLLAGVIYVDELLQNKVEGYGGIPLFQWDDSVGPSYQKPWQVYKWTPEESQIAQKGWTFFGTDFLGRSHGERCSTGQKHLSP